MQETHDWLAQNRFTSYVSLFANYTGADLLRLTRRDLIELCGAADGIRLFNTLRSRTVKVIYITMGQEKGVFLPFKVNVKCLVSYCTLILYKYWNKKYWFANGFSLN